jgi:hypothetical protein
VKDAVTTGVNQLWKDLARDTVPNQRWFDQGWQWTRARANCWSCQAWDHTRGSFFTASTGRPFFYLERCYWIAGSIFRSRHSSLLQWRTAGVVATSYYCVDALTNHPSMVVLVPSSSEAEPLSVIIEHYQPPQRTNSTTYSVHDRGGWLKTRTRQERRWKRLYFVLSEGTMSIIQERPSPALWIGSANKGCRDANVRGTGITA